MKHEEDRLFKTSEFAKTTGVSIRTLRHYEEIGLLKPSYRNEAGHRLYNVDDFIRMQNIITLKFIGFSLHEVEKIMDENNNLKDCLKIQRNVIEKKIKHLNNVVKALKEAEDVVENNNNTNWRALQNVIKAVNMEQYYSNRVKEYENIYNRNDKVRQDEQERIKAKMRDVFIGKNVLEVACGTGYWTETISKVASKLTAVDILEETLIEARKKNINVSNIKFSIGDAYKLEEVEGQFDAACANFWFSHVPKSRIQEFLEGLHRRLEKGSVIFMADNVYVPGIGGEFITKYGEKDTYKIRELSNGEKYEIIKNYYSEEELRNIFEKYADDFHITIGSCFWWIWYVVK